MTMTEDILRNNKEIGKAKIRATNDLISSAYESGLSSAEISTQFGFPAGVDPNAMLASMAVAETYDMPLDRAFSVYPYIKESLYGENANDGTVAKDFFVGKRPFRLPSPTRIRRSGVEIKEEVDAAQRAFGKFKEEKDAPVSGEFTLPEVPDPKDIMTDAAGFRQLGAREIHLATVEDKWFGEGRQRDKLKEKYYDSLYNAKTEEDRVSAKDKYHKGLISVQSDKIDGFRRQEQRWEKSVTDPDGVWLTKWTALRRAGASIGAAEYKIASDIVGLAGNILKSKSMKDLSESLDATGRGYWLTKTTPELMVEHRGWWDKRANNFLENAPYVVGTVSATFLSGLATGGATVPTGVVFFSAAGFEGSNAYHTALDNGFDERSARRRGWLVGTINGAIEAASGGAKKYVPTKGLTRKLGSAVKRLTKKALAEILREELPQEVVSAIFTNDLPYKDDGTINWEEVANRFFELAQDTAFTSVIFGSLQEGSSKLMDMSQQKRLSTEQAQAVDEVLGLMAEGKFDEVQEKIDVAQVPPTEAVTEEEIATKESLTENAADEIPISPVVDQDLNEAIETAPQYYLQQTGTTAKRGNIYVIIDGDTQQEVRQNLDKKTALRTVKELNTGERTVRRQTKTFLPTSETIESMTHTELLNTVFKRVETATRQAFKAGADAIVAMHKDISAYAKSALVGIDITEAQRTGLLSKLAAAKTDTQKSALIQVIENIKERQRKTMALDNHKKLRRYVNANQKGTISDKFMEAVGGLLEPYTLLTAKQINAAKRTKTHLQNLQDGLVENNKLDVAWAKALIPQSLIDTFSDIDKINTSEMNADQLEQLNKDIRHALQLNKLYNKLSQNKRARETRSWLHRTVDLIKTKKQTKVLLKGTQKERGHFKEIHDIFLGTSKDDFATAATKMFGLDSVSLELEQLNARRKQMSTYLQMAEILQRIAPDKDTLARWSPKMQKLMPAGMGQGVKELLGKSTDLFDVDIGGETRQFTMAQLIHLFMHTRNTYNFSQVRNNGVAFRQGILGKIDKNAYGQISEAVNSDPKAVSFADGLQELYELSSELGNEVSLRLFGYKMFEVENFYHIDYFRVGEVMGKEYIRDSLVDEEGRAKARIGSKAPVLILDIFDVLMEDMNVMSNFIGLTEFVQKMRTLANYAPFQEKLDGHRKKHIRKRFNSILHDIQKSRPVPQDAISAITSKVGGNVAKAILIAPRIWALQPLSYLLYSTEASIKYAKTYSWKSRDIQDVLDNWILGKHRQLGYSSTRSMASSANARKVMLGRGTFGDEMLGPLHGADMKTVWNAARITMAEIKDNNMSGKTLRWWTKYGTNPRSLKYGTKDFWQAFNDRADYITSRTQPMFNPENKSQWANSDNQFLREISRFRSFVDQLLRIPSRKIALYQQGEIGVREMVQDVSVAVVLMAVLKALMYFTIGQLSGREQKEGKLIVDIITAPIANIPFVGYPLQKITQVALGQDAPAPEFSTISLAMLDNILLHSYQVALGLKYTFDDERFASGPNKGEWKSDVHFKRGVTGAAGDALMLSGVPIRTVQRIKWFDE